MQNRAHEPSELDAGPRKRVPGAERFCAATGAVTPVDDMIRFVIAPDGAVVPDLKRRLPGRGHLDHGHPPGAPERARAQSVCPWLQARRAAGARFRRIDRTAARTGRARRARDGSQGRKGGGRLRKGRGGAGARAGRGPDPRHGRRPGRGQKARRSGAAANRTTGLEISLSSPHLHRLNWIWH